MKLFDAIVNPYNGCYIGPAQLPDSAAEFAARLAAFVEAWQCKYALVLRISGSSGHSFRCEPASHFGIIRPPISV